MSWLPFDGIVLFLLRLKHIHGCASYSPPSISMLQSFFQQFFGKMSSIMEKIWRLSVALAYRRQIYSDTPLVFEPSFNFLIFLLFFFASVLESSRSVSITLLWLAFFCSQTLLSMVSVLVLRRHLMLWRVFGPRYVILRACCNWYYWGIAGSHKHSLILNLIHMHTHTHISSSFFFDSGALIITDALVLSIYLIPTSRFSPSFSRLYDTYHLEWCLLWYYYCLWNRKNILHDL